MSFLPIKKGFLCVHPPSLTRVLSETKVFSSSDFYTRAFFLVDFAPHFALRNFFLEGFSVALIFLKVRSGVFFYCGMPSLETHFALPPRCHSFLKIAPWDGSPPPPPPLFFFFFGSFPPFPPPPFFFLEPPPPLLLSSNSCCSPKKPFSLRFSPFPRLTRKVGPPPCARL